ncbi:MAG: NDP-hexose 2,3-dehydratase [Euryarchaeota archaeon]|nr:NDP-hexose 2,3-dehydratase [Euryarchaeota archaeon]
MLLNPEKNREIDKWVKDVVDKTIIKTNKILFNDMKNWSFIDQREIVHSSKNFFQIQGLEVSTNSGNINNWHQPIINQSEIGILGIIKKKFEGKYYYLLQAKIEPGNINKVQISPTVQATKSNYKQVHKGSKPLFVEYFLNERKKIILDQLQSEQGGRFLQKRNRNIIIEIEKNIEYPENYKWFTLEEIKTLIRKNNFINMDTRSVIAGINVNKERKILGIVTEQQNSIHSMVEVLSWLTEQKAKYYIQVEKLSLSELNKWVVTESQIHHVNNKYFKVIAVNTEIQNREVMEWSQPMIQSITPGIIAFVVKRINGIIHFIVQAKIEVGNLDIIELAPTLQCMTGDYRDTKSGDLPFLDLVLEVSKKHIIYDTMQSEEGGRFYREENRNLIIQVDEDFDIKLPDRYIWMTYEQLHDFMIFNNYLNIQARSLLSAIRECSSEIS